MTPFTLDQLRIFANTSAELLFWLAAAIAFVPMARSLITARRAGLAATDSKKRWRAAKSRAHLAVAGLGTAQGVLVLGAALLAKAVAFIIAGLLLWFR